MMTETTPSKIIRRHSLPKSRKATTMSSFSHPIAMSAPFAIAALIGATMLASPLTAARADTTSHAAIHLAQAVAPQSQADAGAAETKEETVEQRITNLHTSLNITPEEESRWDDVAQTMRQNAIDMDKLAAANRTTPPQDLTAVDDLVNYEKFAQAHADGLKKLISSFEQLYAAMPDAQKKNADEVFQTFGRKAAASHS
jgi:protein CpxP